MFALNNILVATDFGEPSKVALRYGVELARRSCLSPTVRVLVPNSRLPCRHHQPRPFSTARAIARST